MILCLPVQTLNCIIYIHLVTMTIRKKELVFFFFPGPVCLKMQQWL